MGQEHTNQEADPHVTLNLLSGLNVTAWMLRDKGKKQYKEIKELCKMTENKATKFPM